jgi:pimeloyl-[acyl-carrier protein] methyl ester esterase
MMKLVLLPGMDGTGELYADFIASLPNGFETEIVRYPVAVSLSYSELLGFVQSATKDSESFVLIAESFSTPLAIQFAATNPPNLKVLVLCAGFVASPVLGLRRFLVSLFSSFLFRMRVPDFAIKHILVGADAPPELIFAVKTAISSVRPEVLSARLHAVLECDARENLSRVSVPILYLQAQQDRLVPSSCFGKIRHIKPQISIEKIDGPHLLFQRKPKETAEIVAKFISRLD